LNSSRISYGITPLNANLYTDTTSDALWTWELVSPQLHLPG
jgi:hypothetical protein